MSQGAAKNALECDFDSIGPSVGLRNSRCLIMQLDKTNKFPTIWDCEINKWVTPIDHSWLQAPQQMLNFCSFHLITEREHRITEKDQRFTWQTPGKPLVCQNETVPLVMWMFESGYKRIGHIVKGVREWLWKAAVPVSR